MRSKWVAKWHTAESPEPGSARKRQRLSSPTYDEHFTITQEEMHAFDEIDKQLSQQAYIVPSGSRTVPVEGMEDVEVTTADSGGSGDNAAGEEDRNGPTVQGARIHLVHEEFA